MSIVQEEAAATTTGSQQRFSEVARRLVPRGLREWLYYRRLERSAGAQAGARAVFEAIYDKNWWQSAESRSGPGSELAYTSEFRALLEDWLARHAHEVGTLLDAPCGDFNWMRHVRLPQGMRYIGGDIVRKIVHDNQLTYGTAIRSFLDLDIVTDPLPNADAWLCRDVLFHLPLDMCRAVVERFRASKATYLLSTTFPDAKNDRDIKVGWFREINLEIAPFNLGPPLELFRDDPSEPATRFVGVWRRPGS